MTCHSEINVKTVPNGYLLTVDGQEYMYHSAVKLLDGMFVRVGLGILDYLDTSAIHDLMIAATTWPNAKDAMKNVATMNAEIESLRGHYAKAKERIEKQAETIDELRKALDAKFPKSKSRKNGTVSVKIGRV